ncbi:hypothetical protein Q2429_23035, partial [Escherichia coli]|nr:hypothetical protein [Escherichia coli]
NRLLKHWLAVDPLKSFSSRNDSVALLFSGGRYPLTLKGCVPYGNHNDSSYFLVLDCSVHWNSIHMPEIRI